MPSTTIVLVPNPRLLDPVYNFYSFTDKRDLPRVTDCVGEEDGLSSTNTLYPCQLGCGTERPFQFIVEPGDRIPLQFRIDDYANPDPENPIYGWRRSGDSYWVDLQVMSMDDTVLWEGDTLAIASFFQVGYGEFGGYQTVIVDLAKLLPLLPVGTTCFYFRLRSASFVPPYDTVNADNAPDGVVPVGYSYIDFLTEQIMTWDGTTFVASDPEVKNYYVAEGNHWYRWDGDDFVGLLNPPEYETGAPEYEYRYTMTYRLRHCNEPIVHFQSGYTPGIDCLGIIHNLAENAVGCEPDECKLTEFYYDFKVGGAVQVEALPVSREVSRGGYVIRSSTGTVARMKTWGLPEFVARMIQLVLASPGGLVNGEHWDEFGNLLRNNDNGAHWYLDVTVTREECETIAPC